MLGAIVSFVHVLVMLFFIFSPAVAVYFGVKKLTLKENEVAALCFALAVLTIVLDVYLAIDRATDRIIFTLLMK